MENLISETALQVGSLSVEDRMMSLRLYLLLVKVTIYSMAYEDKTRAVHTFRGFLGFYIISRIMKEFF